MFQCNANAVAIEQGDAEEANKIRREKAVHMEKLTIALARLGDLFANTQRAVDWFCSKAAMAVKTPYDASNLKSMAVLVPYCRRSVKTLKVSSRKAKNEFVL